MFDTHHHGQRSIHSTSHTKITEKRAPTDESIKLLSEMERAAEKKLISITRLDNNTFKATWHLFDDFMADSLRAKVRFELNGQRHELEVPIERHLRFKPDDIAKTIYESILSELAKVLTLEILTAEHKTIGQALRIRP